MRLLTLIAGAFAMSLLGGADGCTVTVEPHEECTELEDVCPNLECEVFATNDDGCEICECADEPPPPDGCYSNEDCAPGEQCDFTQGSEPSGSDDGSSSDEAARYVAPQGECRPYACPAVAEAPPECAEGEVLVCVSDDDDPCGSYCYCEGPPPPPPGDSCFSDDECADGQRCDLREVCSPCADGQPCDLPCVVEGVCVDGDGQCDDDSTAVCEMVPPTCEDGLVLAIKDNCYACVEPSTCEPPPPPAGCEAVLCAPDTVCVESPEGPQCVAVADGCYSDDDCGEGTRCNAEEVCGPPPGCENGEACPDVCYGQCVEVGDDPAQ